MIVLVKYQLENQFPIYGSYKIFNSASQIAKILISHLMGSFLAPISTIVLEKLQLKKNYITFDVLVLLIYTLLIFTVKKNKLYRPMDQFKFKYLHLKVNTSYLSERRRSLFPATLRKHIFSKTIVIVIRILRKGSQLTKPQNCIQPSTTFIHKSINVHYQVAELRFISMIQKCEQYYRDVEML